MDNQKVYLVYEEFDDCGLWLEDSIRYEGLLGGSTNLELAKEKLKHYRDKLLAKEFRPYVEFYFSSTQEPKYHEVGAFVVEFEDMEYDGRRYDVVVRCKDGTGYETGETGLYTYRIVELEMDKFVEEHS